MVWIWFDEWLFASVLLGFFLAVGFRYIKGDSLKLAIFLLGIILQIIITTATLFLALMWFVYLVVSILTCLFCYFLIIPLWIRYKPLKLTHKKAPMDKIAKAKIDPLTLQPSTESPNSNQIYESKVIELLEEKWGFGFEIIHEGVIFAMSKGNHTESEITTFLDIHREDVKEAISFMKKKGVFPHRFPSARQATEWAKSFIEEALKL